MIFLLDLGTVQSAYCFVFHFMCTLAETFFYLLCYIHVEGYANNNEKTNMLELLILPEHPNSPLGFSRVCVAPSFVFCRSLFVLFLLSIVFVLLRFTASEPMFSFFCCCFCFVICVFLVAIALCVLRFTASNYPLGII